MLAYRQATRSRSQKLIMNVLNRTCLKQFFRYKEMAAVQIPKFYAEPLSKRALIRVRGQEVVPFLQGLITNDMKHLYEDGQQSMFTMFLNNSGRILFDTIIYKTPALDTYLIECDRDVSNDLRRHLRLYRVKKKIDIDSINSEYVPWVVYNPVEGSGIPEPSDVETRSADILYSHDPRVKELGIRVIQPRNYQIKDLAKFFPKSALEQPNKSQYSSHRYCHGVGEGCDDLPPGKCFPLEANCDFLNGISFQKGCYVGQELTARVYHTGVVRKRLMPLKLSTTLDGDVKEVQTQAGAVVGKIRGASQRRALALLRVEQVLNAQELMIDGDPCKAYKPSWWPKKLPTKQPFRYH